jgi:hypothetical protein
MKSRKMGWVEHVARTGDRRGVSRLFVWKPEGKGPLGRCTLNEDNIKLSSKVGWRGMDWFYLI